MVIDAGSLTTTSGNVTINTGADAALDAGGLGPGGGEVLLIGSNLTTTVKLGSLDHMAGTLTVTSADGVTLTAQAGLATLHITGTASDDTLTGSKTAANVIDGEAGNDTLVGGDGDDLLTGSAGDDTLDGGGGFDTAVFSGDFADYSIVHNADASLTVSDLRAGSPDGTDILRNIELLQFADAETPCYCRGTLIRTACGEVAVENLRIGDRVMTASGALRPIKWIGRRSYGGRFIIGRKDILPVCIKAGALDDNVPERDLWISPHHAMYLDGVLVDPGISLTACRSYRPTVSKASGISTSSLRPTT